MKLPSWSSFPYIFWIAVSFLLMLVLSLRFTYDPVGGPTDGPSLYGYGFPVAWLRWDMASSLHSIVSLPGLTLNLASILACLWFPILKLRPRKTLFHYSIEGLGAFFLVGLCTLIILASDHLHPIWSSAFDEGWKKTKTEIYFGVIGNEYGPD